MNMTADNMTVTGGTTDQQQAIVTAHNGAVTLLTSTATKAASGSGSFSTWFGSSDLTVTSLVSGQYTSMATALQSTVIVYDLDNQTSPVLAYQGIYVIFSPNSTTAANIDASLWSEYWQASALDASSTATQLIYSIVHQISGYTASDEVYEFSDTADSSNALQLVALSPTLAPKSIRNYMLYAQSASSTS